MSSDWVKGWFNPCSAPHVIHGAQVCEEQGHQRLLAGACFVLEAIIQFPFHQLDITSQQPWFLQYVMRHNIIQGCGRLYLFPPCWIVLASQSSLWLEREAEIIDIIDFKNLIRSLFCISSFFLVFTFWIYSR